MMIEAPRDESLGPDATGQVTIERLYPDAAIPERATPGSAGCDLRAYLRDRSVRFSDGASIAERRAVCAEGEWAIVLAPGGMALVPVGFRTRLPQGIEAQIRPRSGQVLKQALTVPNSPGTVDPDYAEEWMVIVRNDAEVERRIVHGERIAQVVFARYESPAIVEGPVTRSTERAGGFGSTGRS